MKLTALDAPAGADIGLRGSLVGSYLARADMIVGAFGCVTVALLGLMNGGYFATSWGWGAVASLWVATVALVLSYQIRLNRYELALLSGLLAFLLFTAASWIWSVSPPAAIRELERGTLLLAVVITAMLLARRRMRPLLAGTATGIVIASCYGLATRLFPTHLGSFDAVAGYRLAEPLGYWNAVGVFSAIGALLGLAFAARGRTALARALGSTVPVLLLPVMYFTFGRGPWGALGLGLLTAIALDRRRLQLISTTLALTPFVGVALWMCAREPALNRRAASLSDAASEGRRLAIILVALAACAAFVGPLHQIAEHRVAPGRKLRVVFGGALLAIVLIGIGIGVVRYGSPQHIAKRAYHAFKAPPATVEASSNLSQRLFSVSNSGRLTQWSVAIDDYRAHPWLGSGAGTYELSWMKGRPYGSWKVRDAHNLYVEVLAELGPIGLGLLVFVLAIPIVAAVKVRRHPLVPLALGAYVAYLLHAAVDWDWEMPAVTLAALLCGLAILVTARSDVDRRAITRRVRLIALTATSILASFAFVGLMGNLAIAASNKAASNSKWQDSARHAREAKRWMPWSSEPWRLQGEAQYVLGNFDAARANFRKAIAKDPNNWLLWTDLATVGTHGTWRAPARRALQLNPLAPELAEFRKALGSGG